MANEIHQLHGKEPEKQMMNNISYTANRIYSIDLLRGLVMVIMALDHTRDFFHAEAFTQDPLDFATTNIFLYFTRWITNFCAPIFVFLAGISIYLQSLRKSKHELSLFLLKRGLWLIAMELVVVGFSWTFDFTYQLVILQVIWAFGISMVFMSLLIRLPYKFILFLGVLIVAGHNLLDNIESTHHGLFWDLARNGNFAVHPLFGGRQLAIIYPFLPWLGVMMLGYCFGIFYSPEVDAKHRKKILLRTGISLLLLFVVVRVINIYGDPYPWTVQKDGFWTFLSFINTYKYPPSLLYLCLFIGPGLLFLAFTENTSNRWSRIISVYGKVPFFYYILHFYLIHTVCMVLFLLRGHPFGETTPAMMGVPFRFIIPGEGYSLPYVYLIWICIVIALYPLCVWFGNYKKQRNYWWLKYL